MRKLVTVMALLLVAVVFQGGALAASSVVKPEAAMKKAFPQVRVDSFGESPIKGLYEVVSGQNIYYYYQEKDLLVVGEIYSKDQNLTGGKKQALKAKLQQQALSKLKDLPLDKAIKVGSGPKTIIEFTDPDCPYCRRASEALKGKSDVTRYVFLSPLAHPGAAPKVQYVLAAKDQEQAYHDMMAGKPVPSPAVDYGKEIKALAEEHLALARSLGIEGTPTFFINKQMVVGADMDKINSLLKDLP